MFSTILSNIVFSMCIIVLCHFIWEYCKDSFTKKYTKDLVHFQTKKYKQMFNEIKNQNNVSVNNNIAEQQTMKDDLVDFINSQTQNLLSEKLI